MSQFASFLLLLSGITGVVGVNWASTQQARTLKSLSQLGMVSAGCEFLTPCRFES
jgi:hypothetical protein